MRGLCRICTVQIQPGKHVRDHAGYTAPNRQHELDHTQYNIGKTYALKDLDVMKWQWMVCPRFEVLYKYHRSNRVHDISPRFKTVFGLIPD